MGAVVAMTVLLSEDWNDNAESHSGPQLLASSKDRFRHRFAISSLLQRPEEAEPLGHNRQRHCRG